MKKLMTPWGENISHDNILQEYPRPQFKRESYLNLNGYWDYAICKEVNCPNYQGQILVPFSPESILSGVNMMLQPDEYLFYHKKIVLPSDFLKDSTILHFGAVDQIAEVWINNQYAFIHQGGYTPFSVDISNFLNGQELDIIVRVRDFTDTKGDQTGKQRINRGGIWYTPQSGIWQTVWMESLPENHIIDFQIIPIFDEKSILFKLNKTGNQKVFIKVFFNNTEQGFASSSDNNLVVKLNELYPWTPETPNIYTIKIYYDKDTIDSYIGMRIFERKKDSNGIERFFLNHKPYFQSGVLDQGYYPDGLLTPPSDEAMVNDIVMMKKMGFNMLRKHIKIEPLRYYYHCDHLGIIVWQDMINGTERPDIILHGILAICGIHIKDNHYKIFGRNSLAARNQYQIELLEMIKHLQNVTSIAVWVPFNESWGQFDAVKTETQIRAIDDSRLIDHASGWSDQKSGDFYSRHIYFTKIKFRKKLSFKRIPALTEFGGYSLPIEGHRFNESKIFGYKKFNTVKDLENGIKNLFLNEIIPQIENGLSVLIYTQLSDVEDEINGFLTYDRKIVKIDFQTMLSINNEIYKAFSNNF